MTFTTENHTGADCSGTTGQTGRILTLSNTSVTTGVLFQVFKNGVLLTLTTDYTVVNNVVGSTVTFVAALLDAAVLVVNYQQNVSPNYCTYSDVYERTGLSTVEVSSGTVTDLILYAEAELESITGRKFTSGNVITETINAPKKRYYRRFWYLWVHNKLTSVPYSINYFFYSVRYNWKCYSYLCKLNKCTNSSRYV